MEREFRTDHRDQPDGSDATSSAAAHTNAIRIEALSYLSGFAVATAAATMVGQAWV